MQRVHERLPSLNSVLVRLAEGSDASAQHLAEEVLGFDEAALGVQVDREVLRNRGHRHGTLTELGLSALSKLRQERLALQHLPTRLQCSCHGDNQLEDPWVRHVEVILHESQDATQDALGLVVPTSGAQQARKVASSGCRHTCARLPSGPSAVGHSRLERTSEQRLREQKMAHLHEEGSHNFAGHETLREDSGRVGGLAAVLRFEGPARRGARAAAAPAGAIGQGPHDACSGALELLGGLRQRLQAPERSG
mmetsp:Transcript_80366/g.233336  ORF Transcript_80366/g.233336 Transcript_80366/m.233336 type:complete len:251 (-) Transcript_80366:425-1177(-)